MQTRTLKLLWNAILFLLLSSFASPSLAKEVEAEQDPIQLIMDWRDGKGLFSDLLEMTRSLTEEYWVEIITELAILDGVIEADEASLVEDRLQVLSTDAHRLFGMPLNLLTPSEIEVLVKQHPEFQDFNHSESPKVPPSENACGYVSSTRYDPAMTQQAGYNFQGHTAIYFRVDGQADCYRKIAGVSTFGSDCGDGSLPYWGLACKAPNCQWYQWSGKYVKDIILLVPTRWWWFYAWASASERASWFSIFWRYDHPMECCDPGCGH